MVRFTRREFLRTASAVSALAAMSAPSMGGSGRKKKIAFSTIGCPGWDLSQIVSFARKHGYRGVEFRGLNGELNLLKSAHFTSAAVAVTRRLIEDNGLDTVCLGSSAQMHHRDTAELARHFDEARGYIDLANKLGCPYVRVFPEKLAQDEEKNSSLDWIGDNLAKLGEYAGAANVSVLLESHGDLVRATDLEQVMKRAQSKSVGLIWDLSNMWTVTGESPDRVYSLLKPFIKHVHVKDALKTDGKIQYVLPGKGVVPIGAALSVLVDGGYAGFYSFEWEKLWHPELDEPENALAYYPLALDRFKQ